MDLRTIRERIIEKKYQLTSDFLGDVSKIYENSVIYNSKKIIIIISSHFAFRNYLINILFIPASKSLITEYALNLVNLCKQRLKEKAEQLEKLERLINPLLDDDQVMW